MPIVGGHDVFEFRYMGLLRAKLGQLGLLVNYEYDRAALDLGVHLYSGPSKADGSRQVTGGRVWMQAKGIHAGTLSASKIASLTSVAVDDLPVEQVRYWYASAEPVYLIVYLEATDQFLAADVRELIDAQRDGEAGLAILNQQTLTLRVPIDATLERAILRMPSHRSIRIDGPVFRGRPLGHGYDPLRSALAPLPPETFSSLVHALLAAHGYQPSTTIDCSTLAEKVGKVTATTGRLGATYEWTETIFTEFGFDLGTDWRVESPPFHVHGNVLVVVHSDVKRLPEMEDPLAQPLRDALLPDSALVFVNAPDEDAFGGWRAAMDSLSLFPQGLGSLAFNVLVTTSVYLDFVDRLQWEFVNYL